MSFYYILIDHETKPADDVLEWARWFETAERHVAKRLFWDLYT